MDPPEVFDLTRRFVGLGADGAVPLRMGSDFWADLSAGRLGPIDRLVSCWYVERDWDHWEYCAKGGDLVCLVSGTARLALERDGEETGVELQRPGETLLLPAGTWYRAQVSAPAMLLFITPGRGSASRPR